MVARAEKLPSRVITPSEVWLDGTPSQLSVLGCVARFIIVFASRRFGKTTAALLKVIKTVSRPNAYGIAWWVAPTYRQAAKPFRALLRALQGTGLIKSYSKSEMVIDFVTGWRLEFRTAVQEDNLRGEGVNLLVIDEIGQLKDELWDEALRPTLADTNGELFGIGTPRGKRGFGYRLFQRGQLAEHQADYRGFRFTAYDGVFIPRKELDEARTSMPAKAFDQEFMAAFLDATGTVFELARTRFAIPEEGEPVALGADWAKKVDWTWFAAVGVRSGAVYETKRLPQRLPYPRQVELFHDFYQKWSAKTMVTGIAHDQTGVGEAVADLINELPDLSCGLEGFTFTEKTKTELVQETAVDLEAGKLGWIEGKEASDPDYGRMLQEFEDYSLTIKKTGKITYGAPDGLHDDAVTAVMLADRARRNEARMPEARVTTW